MDNKTLRKSESKQSYVLLVIKDGVIKGVASKGHFKRHIECTVKPTKMQKFSSEDKAIEHYKTISQIDCSLAFHKVAKLNIEYTLD